MLNPISISVFGSDQGAGDPSIALAALDNAIAHAVATANAATTVPNQVTIIPGVLIYDSGSTTYTANATIVYPG